MYYYDYYGDHMNLSENYPRDFQEILTNLGMSTIYLTLLISMTFWTTCSCICDMCVCMKLNKFRIIR